MSNGREIRDGAISLYFNGLRIISVEWLAGPRMATTAYGHSHTAASAHSLPITSSIERAGIRLRRRHACAHTVQWTELAPTLKSGSG